MSFLQFDLYIGTMDDPAPALLLRTREGREFLRTGQFGLSAQRFKSGAKHAIGHDGADIGVDLVHDFLRCALGDVEAGPGAEQEIGQSHFSGGGNRRQQRAALGVR
jgi:hypothetical protein